MSKSLIYIEKRSTPLSDQEAEIQNLLFDDIKNNSELEKRGKAIANYGAFTHATRLLREHGVEEIEELTDEDYDDLTDDKEQD